VPSRVDSNKSRTLTATQVTVATTATLIAAANPNRKFIEIVNTDAAVNVFIGGSGVTTSNGHAIYPGGAGKLTLRGAITTAAIYGIVAASTEVVTVLEF
jgi:hypothetical protein